VAEVIVRRGRSADWSSVGNLIGRACKLAKTAGTKTGLRLVRRETVREDSWSRGRSASTTSLDWDWGEKCMRRALGSVLLRSGTKGLRLRRGEVRDDRG